MNPPMIKSPKLQTGDKAATVSLSWGGAGKIPHGVQAEIDCDQKQFRIIKNAVVDGDKRSKNAE